MGGLADLVLFGPLGLLALFTTLRVGTLALPALPRRGALTRGPGLAIRAGLPQPVRGPNVLAVSRERLLLPAPLPSCPLRARPGAPLLARGPPPLRDSRRGPYARPRLGSPARPSPRPSAGSRGRRSGRARAWPGPPPGARRGNQGGPQQ